MLKLKNPNSKRRWRRGEANDGRSLVEIIREIVKRFEEEEAKRRNWYYWSELPPDLIHSVLERLSIPDLQRAKSVCSDWLYASRKCAPKSQIPWLIVFPEDSINGVKLLNPEEEDKMYTSQDLGVGFAESVCIATHGCWLLMRNPLFNLYIVNLLTGQRISLPPVESQRGEIKLERIVDNKFHSTLAIGSGDTIGFEIHSPRLWIDEDARDYLVILSIRIPIWSFHSQYTVVCKKGDDSWTQLPECSPSCDLVYKHQKLYMYRYGAIQIFDFYGELPQTNVSVALTFDTSLTLSSHRKKNMVVTVSGDVLMVTSVKRITWSFDIYKMNSSKNKWDNLVSLRDEAILLDLGITVPAKDIEGIYKNSIYFSDKNDMFIYHLQTQEIERPHHSLFSSLQYSHARWFFPAFIRKS